MSEKLNMRLIDKDELKGKKERKTAEMKKLAA
jgi:hypothetical protein